MTSGSNLPYSSLEPQAKDRVSIGPCPTWVQPCIYPTDFRRQERQPITYLLFNRQVHADSHQIFQHLAIRLETMEAVQHESQWRLSFEPATQSVVIHFIRVRRGDAINEQAHLERLRFLQREEGLERFVIDGWTTMLLLLDDVRPGDVLEMAYTTTDRPRLLPEHCSVLFALPASVAVGYFSVSVQYSAQRDMQWKAPPNLKPVESVVGDDRRLEWSARELRGTAPEPNTPEGHLPPIWVQISDCPDWRSVAVAIAAAWEPQRDEPTVTALAREIAEAEPKLEAQIEKALRLVQDDYRYLSLNLELGGGIPTRPETVIRRRFGDCKDLSFLLAQLLTHLGVPARPILVATGLRKTVSGMLPMAALFNHVVVEFTLAGRTIWIDPTIKLQGGGARHRVIADFGAGLPVDGEATALSPMPAQAEDANTYELTETLLLSTSGSESLLALKGRATGAYADGLRQQFALLGAKTLEDERLKLCMQRFGNAARKTRLDHRDNRRANEIVFTEIFAIGGFLASHRDAGRCNFQLPPSILFGMLPVPEEKARKKPFALPYPCHIVHTFEIESQSLQPMAAPRRNFSNAFLRFSRRQKCLNHYWSMTVELTTLTSQVSAKDVPEFRDSLQEMWKESGTTLVFPTGLHHPRPKADFGKLPELPRRESPPIYSSPSQLQPAAHPRPVVEIARESAPATASPGIANSTPTAAPSRAAAGDKSVDPPFTPSAPRPQKRSRRRPTREFRRSRVPGFIVGILLTAALAFIGYLVAVRLYGKL